MKVFFTIPHSYKLHHEKSEKRVKNMIICSISKQLKKNKPFQVK